ncbi:MAG: hypothetical protein ABW133_25745 [Polyangiaceae bacterium]
MTIEISAFGQQPKLLALRGADCADPARPCSETLSPIPELARELDIAATTDPISRAVQMILEDKSPQSEALPNLQTDESSLVAYRRRLEGIQYLPKDKSLGEAVTRIRTIKVK